jgi:2-oxoglutarate ferredoxin oxidoreductase subunit beta
MDFVERAREITTEYAPGTAKSIALHDGSRMVLTKPAEDFDPTDPIRSHAYVRERQLEGRVATGLLYINQENREMHELMETTAAPLVDIPYERLRPTNKQLQKLQDALG